MSDKELLEEFRVFIDFMYESIDIEDHQRFIAISESMLKDGWFKWIYKYSKEQAVKINELEEIIYQDHRQEVLEGLYDDNQKLKKRVQELEEANKKNYWISSDFKFENLKLEQQNKRYREAIKNAVGKFNYDEHQEGMSILLKALEEYST